MTLAIKGITDVIVADSRTSYKLPPAEYNYVGNESADAVLDAAQASAAKTARRDVVFVTEAARQTWIGLETLQARRSA